MTTDTNTSRESLILDIEYMIQRFDATRLMRVLWYLRRIW